MFQNSKDFKFNNNFMNNLIVFSPVTVKNFIEILNGIVLIVLECVPKHRFHLQYGQIVSTFILDFSNRKKWNLVTVWENTVSSYSSK